MKKSVKEKTAGFTLIELLIVIAIISILVTIVVLAVNPRRIIQDSQDTKRRTEMNQLKAALQLYFNDNSAYPPDLDTLKTQGYTRELPIPAPQYAVSGADYDAAIELLRPTTEGNDTNTATRCATILSGVSGDYYICPD